MIGAGTRDSRSLVQVYRRKMSAMYLKGLCTRYRNLIETEIGKADKLVSIDVFEEDPSALLRNVETSVRRIKDFRAKLEETMEKWSMVI